MKRKDERGKVRRRGKGEDGGRGGEGQKRKRTII